MKAPDYIRGNNPKSFSYYTIESRFPKILDIIINDNKLTDLQHTEITNLKQNIDKLIIEKIENNNFSFFNTSITRHYGLSIYDAPFFVAEIFFYQKIADLLNFYDDNIDYFSLTKLNSLKACDSQIESLALELSMFNDSTVQNYLSNALLYSLWGNLADLSLFKLENTFKYQSGDDNSEDNILINDSSLIADTLLRHKDNVHIFLDNAGFELISDMYLIAVLLKATTCNIIIHTKPIPMFVSDTTQEDWDITLTYLKQYNNTRVNQWANNIMTATDSNRIVTVTNDFWASGYSFSDDWFVHLGIGTKDIIISKGDLNYRRYFEDRTWNYSTPTKEASFVKEYQSIMIRTLKSEIITGINENTVSILNELDKDWLINGKYGLIQLI